MLILLVHCEKYTADGIHLQLALLQLILMSVQDV